MLKDNERNDKQDEAMRMKRKEMKKKNERMKRGKKNVRVKNKWNNSDIRCVLVIRSHTGVC